MKTSELQQKAFDLLAQQERHQRETEKFYVEIIGLLYQLKEYDIRKVSALYC